MRDIDLGLMILCLSLFLVGVHSRDFRCLLYPSASSTKSLANLDEVDLRWFWLSAYTLQGLHKFYFLWFRLFFSSLKTQSMFWKVHPQWFLAHFICAKCILIRFEWAQAESWFVFNHHWCCFSLSTVVLKFKPNLKVKFDLSWITIRNLADYTTQKTWRMSFKIIYSFKQTILCFRLFQLSFQF